MTMPHVPEANATLASSDAALLLGYLEDEADAQSGILAGLADKERAIITHDLPTLERLLAESMPVIACLEELTQRRLRITSLIGRRLGVPVAEITMSSVIARAAPEERARLTAAHTALRDIVARVGLQNRRIHVVTRHALETNRGLVDVLFGGAGSGPRGYSRNGERTVPTEVATHFSREI